TGVQTCALPICIVLITSTNGTRITAARNSSGRMLSTAPMSRSGAAALDDEAVGGGVAAGDQMLGARDEVGERVALLEHAAGIVPALAQVSAAADVGDREGHAALEQAQPARREHDRVRKAVRAVAREQERA